LAWTGGAGLLHDSPASLVAAFAALMPYLIWEALVAHEDQHPQDESASGRWAAPLWTGLFCAAAGWLDRFAAAGAPPHGERAAEALAFMRSSLTHAALFLGATLAYGSARLLASRTSNPRRTRAALDGACAWILAALVLRELVLDSLSWQGAASWAYASVLGGAAALALTRSRPGRLIRAAASSRIATAAASLILIAVPAGTHLALRGADWNRLIETLATLSVWAAAAALISARHSSDQAGVLRRRIVAAIALSLTLFAVEGSTRLLDGVLRRHLILAPEGVRLLAERDVSLGVARRTLGAAKRDDFYSYLRRNISLPQGTTPRKELSFIDGPLNAAAPSHVFIIVIDSLRRDYLGAYEPAIKFTPNFDAFAREADVFPGFTAYGGTALSEPSIWAGARLPHEQYPAPFHSFNTLEKLIDGLGYRPLITMDVLLTRILDANKSATALDKKTVDNYKLCATLAELERRLDDEAAAGKPLFVYTQPQDIHISVIGHEGGVPPADPRWAGLHAPYAARVAAMDACFGGFIKALKAKALYDKSIVVLTSDHGDSLGEGGRWGHAYTLFPEIARVPLIIRLPPSRRAGLKADLMAPAFLTDITPSLYAALGLGPRDAAEPYGRSLYAPTTTALESTRRDERLMVSSYGPVFGVLGGGGDWLYIADAVDFTSRWYALKNDPRGTRDLIDPEKDARGRAAVRARTEELRAFYSY
ncbi:MAG: hypothetical protein COV48_06365, partial [Elusimicrobia bacterium CG11_big_fil_rev_8_21_14_0_20_64_6]